LIDSGVRAGVVELRTAESREDEALPQHTACTNRTQKEVRGEKPHRHRADVGNEEQGEGGGEKIEMRRSKGK
jgi:hypothetical protein